MTIFRIVKVMLLAVGLTVLGSSVAPSLRADYEVPRPTKDTWIGHRRALVILLEWPNRPQHVSQAEVEKTFFGMGENDHSLRQYLLENSGGKFDLTGTVLPWTKAQHKWGRLWCMFQEKFADMFDRTSGCSPKTILREAWAVAKDQIKISDYDSDGDGKIDHLFVVHSGRLWKPRGTPDDVFDYRFSNAQEAGVFQSQGIGRIGTMIPIGFFLHESGHNHFGLGDYYGDSPGYEHGRYGLGMWGIMGLGAWGTSNAMPASELFRYPAPYEAPSKIRIGWARTQVFTQSMRHVRLKPVEASAEVAVIPLGHYQADAYFLEYRANRGFSRNTMGNGLLIWHGWELMQADGRNDLNHGRNLKHRPLPPNKENFGDSSDPFPGSMNVTSFRDPKSGLLIENIVQTPEYVDFDITFPNAAVEAESFAALRAALKTESKSYLPDTLNGHAWNVDLYPPRPGQAVTIERVGPLFTNKFDSLVQ